MALYEFFAYKNAKYDATSDANRKYFRIFAPTNVSHPVESPIQHMCGDTDGSSYNVGCSSVHTYKRLAMLSGSWVAVHALYCLNPEKPPYEKEIVNDHNGHACHYEFTSTC